MPCSDGNCKLRLEPVTGQHTNGGCKCLEGLPTDKRIEVERLIQRLRELKSQRESLVGWWVAQDNADGSLLLESTWGARKRVWVPDASEPSKGERLLRERAVTISRSYCQVRIRCDSVGDADAVFDWLEGLTDA